jgi:hypothetical protein
LLFPTPLLIFISAINTTPQVSARLKPCQVAGIKEQVLCGSYEVWENRKSKKGRKIALNIVVLPSLSATPAADPLFALAGGPGQAATDGAPVMRADLPISAATARHVLAS